MILIVSSTADEHATAVMESLRRMGHSPLLWDTAGFPRNSSLSLRYEGSKRDYQLQVEGREVSGSEIHAVWWRRPGQCLPHPDIQRESHRIFALNECHEALAGFWQALDCRWINHPTRDEVAARKVYQLRAAQDVGLTVPKTLVTNSPAATEAFVHQMPTGKAIYKSFSATEREWRETRLLGQAELEKLNNIQYAPVIFQEYIEADVDVRVTVVGEQVFAAAIYSQQSSYKVDFRMDMLNVPVEALELPNDVVTALQAFMSHMGLVYGAIDMRRTVGGKFVFLEVNPAGQWRFIEQRTGQPITDAIARKLVEFDHDGSTEHR